MLRPASRVLTAYDQKADIIDICTDVPDCSRPIHARLQSDTNADILTATTSEKKSADRTAAGMPERRWFHSSSGRSTDQITYLTLIRLARVEMRLSVPKTA